MKKIKNKIYRNRFDFFQKEKMGFYILFLFFLLGEGFRMATIDAQQLPIYSNYTINNYILNPAAGGVNPYFEGFSDNRYQWSGITDAPRTYILSVDGPTKSLNVGLGGMVFTDIVGPTRRTGFYLSYAYHFKVQEKINVSLGLSAGLLQFMVDASKITLRDLNDVVISNGVQSMLTPDFGAGIYAYSTDKKWYAGASIPQLFENRVSFAETTTSATSKLATHFYVTGGYKYDLNNDFKLEPTLMINYVKPAPIQFDLDIRAIYQEKMWVGVGYRYLDAVSIKIGYIMQENLTFAYAYDLSTSDIRKYSSGTNEIMIGIKFNKVKNSNGQEKKP